MVFSYLNISVTQTLCIVRITDILLNFHLCHMMQLYSIQHQKVLSLFLKYPVQVKPTVLSSELKINSIDGHNTYM